MARYAAPKAMLAAGAVALALCGSCSRETDPRARPTEAQTRGGAGEREGALVRVIAAVANEPAVEIAVNERVAFPELRYKTVTEYQELDGKEYRFAVLPAGDRSRETLAEDREELGEGSHYTVVAYSNANGKAELAAFADDLTAPRPGKAKLRVIQAAPEAGEVDVYASGQDTLIRDLEPGTNSEYLELVPVEITLQIRPEGKRTSLLTLDNVSLEAGGIYTIVLLGHSPGKPHMEAIQIEDRVRDGGWGKLVSVCRPL